jgi:uncharacterized membrane protein
MNKIEFIKILKSGLKDLPKEEIDSILADYEEHFAIGKTKKKREDSIAKSLGDPKQIAKQYKVQSVVKQAEEKKSVKNILRAVFATISLGFFNLVFVLGIFIGLVGTLIGLFGVAMGIVAGGLVGLVASIFVSVLPGLFFGIPAVAGMFVSIGLIALGVLFFIADCFLAKWFYKLTLAYLKFNVKIVRGEKK